MLKFLPRLCQYVPFGVRARAMAFTHFAKLDSSQAHTAGGYP
ncbi:MULTISPECIES: hypothetical protein [unclassified Helicobacter]|nr:MULTISPECIES: hypothetical protein [unclassified Helicobacter]